MIMRGVQFFGSHCIVGWDLTGHYGPWPEGARLSTLLAPRCLLATTKMLPLISSRVKFEAGCNGCDTIRRSEINLT